jgi:signal transduction histidine kinase
VRAPSLRLLLAVPAIAAAVLGVALVWLAAVAAHTLRERDDAVRQGVLLRLGHELETDLREAGPDEAAATLGRFLAAHAEALAGVELVGPQGVIAGKGTLRPTASEQPAMLGPRWRPAGGMMGRGAGPGRGTLGTLRLQPAKALGASDRLASVMMAEAERRRLEVVALAGAGLAHRLRNPLAGIKGTTQLLLEGAAPPTEARARRILEASERIEVLLGRLLAFARPPEASPETLDLVALTERVAGRTPGVVRVSSRGAVPAWADGEHVESILEELLGNARAFDPEGELEVEVRREGRAAVAEVRDRGLGLAVHPERAFDPYVTTRPEGAGLGLAIVRALANANGGDATLAARAGGGCVARLELPPGKG